MNLGSAGAGDRGREESGDGDEQCWKQGGAELARMNTIPSGGGKCM